MRIRVGVSFVFGMLFLVGVASAQTPAPPATGALTFDVASVRPTGLTRQSIAAMMQAGKTPRMGPRVDGLLATYSYMTLTRLIANAYKMSPYLITGPSWLDDQQFDIEARMPEGVRLRHDQKFSIA
jgi:uncharacterized protein (TIGR03435 family)